MNESWDFIFLFIKYPHQKIQAKEQLGIYFSIIIKNTPSFAY